MTFTYTPLSGADKEIRLVILRHGEDASSPLECELIHTKLGSGEKYEALSYVWGGDCGCLDQPHQLVLNTAAFPIKHNLHTALLFLRDKTIDRTFWVDAICINQDDLEERAQQVGIMRDIFTNCTTDIFWMGIDTGQLMHDGMEVTKRLASSPVGGGFRINTGDVSDLESLYSIPTIWSRVWVMQEIACAPEVKLVAGFNTLDWDAVECIVERDDLLPPADAFHLPGSHGSFRLVQYKEVIKNAQIVYHQRSVVKSVRQGRKSSLLDVLVRFKDTHATDPRDKIYGLLGLVSEQHTIVVDYRKPASELYMETALYLINSSRNLDILSQSQWQRVENRARMADLPSWVPDFAAPGYAPLLFAQRAIYSAGGDTCSAPCTVLDGRILQLDGIWLGKLELIPFSKELPNRLRLLNPLDSSQDQTRKNASDSVVDDQLWTYPPTNEPRLQAYWRTLVGDCIAFPIRRLNEDEIKAGSLKLEQMVGKGADFSTDLHLRSLGRVVHQMRSRMKGDRWQFGVSDSGFFCMASAFAKSGDLLVVVPGAKTPLVVREAPAEAADASEGGHKSFVLVGPAYVHGFMDGQAASWAEGRLRRHSFHLA